MSRIGCWGCLFGVAIASANTFNAHSALAQITPDGTLPNNSIVTPSGNTINITGGTQAGNNLFHSFQEFSIRTGNGAFFNNALNIQNIISRVTGGSISNIDGFIRANGSANVFLLNPNGIIFGPNASLNVGGSFVATTANAIQFGNIGFFSATNPEAPSPLLTINPSALVSNQIAAAIQNNSVAPAGRDPAGFRAFGLGVPDGKSLLLVGGNVNMDGGGLNAYGGRVELGGLASAGTVGLEVNGNNLSLNFPDNATRADVSLTNGASVRVDAGGGGSIAVNARNLDILGGSFLAAGIGQGLGSVGSQAGDITLNATGEIKLVGSYVFNNVGSRATGNSGNINITTGSLSLNDGGRLDATSFGQGNAGSVSVRASGAVELAGSSTAIFSSVELGGVGKGGNIDIKAASLSLKDGAELLTFVGGRAFNNQPVGRGDAGNVTVDVTERVTIAGVRSGIFSTVDPRAVGNGGNITISSGDFSLSDGGRLNASTLGQGNAGSVSVRATNSVELVNGDILSTVAAGGVGNGGNININAATLSLKDGAQLQTLVRRASDTQPAGRGDAGNITIDVTGPVTIAGIKDGNPSAIFSFLGTGAVGTGGNITISSGDFSLSDGAQLSASTFGQGNAGSVSVRATNSVELVNGAIFSYVQAGGVGNGGNINITTGSFSLTDGAALIASTLGQGNAGSVSVRATNSVELVNGNIFSTVGAGGVGNGGNINITTGSFSLTDGAALTASTLGQGNAGSVSVRATNSVELVNGNIFSTVAAGGVGNGGNININAATLSLKDSAQLATAVREASSDQPPGRGDAGNVTVDVTGPVTIAGVKDSPASAIFSSVETGAVGNGGNITISSGSLSLSDGGRLNASTLGQGNAGSVSVRATNSVELVNNVGILSTVGLTGVGNGGNININAASVSLKDGAQITASSTGDGAAGNIEVDTRSIRVARKRNKPESLFSNSPL
ncbi:two-partner secretion domain-containing protein, partial [Scytonema sp. HK-05]|uniref:two-partner secretion domain-containing protein n=1 Tax=Scytonema sp. HK-05 TaxID=1137095 RepID=UPI000937B203